MDWLYKKVMAWMVGEALANSDRVKVGIVGAIMAGFTVIAAKCGFCGQFLTPDLADKLAAGIVVLAVKLIHSLDTRDVAAPGETVAGAAEPAKPYVDVRAAMGDK